LGKLIACILMIVGIGFFALITGAVAQRFLATEIEEVGEEMEASEAELLEQIEVLGRQLQTLEASLAHGNIRVDGEWASCGVWSPQRGVCEIRGTSEDARGPLVVLASVPGCRAPLCRCLADLARHRWLRGDDVD
jgi:hypothetical protein